MKNNLKAIVIGGSAGSFDVVKYLVRYIKPDLKLPVFLVLHRLKHINEGIAEVLSYKSNMTIVEPLDKEKIKGNKIYVAPANYHLIIELGYTIALSTDEAVNYSRPAIDITMDSAALSYSENLAGIILSGANKDGARGMKKIKEKGGFTVIQDPNEAQIQTMPNSVLELFSPDKRLNTDQILQFINSL